RVPHALEAVLAAPRGLRPRAAARPVLIVGSRRDLAPIAKRAGIPFLYADWRDRTASEKKVLAALDAQDVDFIALARFMKILSPAFCWRWRNKIVNIHPSLLPSFPGASAYRQAWEHGVRVVGVTAHFVTPDLDQGPIIHQDAFRIPPNASYEEIVKRGQALEAKVLVEAVRLFLTKRLDVHWGRVWSE
ncbi:MAG: formyltransferase family protein, partial [Thermoplasmatota archaeon]